MRASQNNRILSRDVKTFEDKKFSQSKEENDPSVTNDLNWIINQSRVNSNIQPKADDDDDDGSVYEDASSDVDVEAEMSEQETQQESKGQRVNPRYSPSSFLTMGEIIKSGQVEHFKQAMQDEYFSLVKHQVLEVVDKPNKKLDSNGKIIRHKARLVAQGYNQVQGLHFHEKYVAEADPILVRLFFVYP